MDYSVILSCRYVKKNFCLTPFWPDTQTAGIFCNKCQTYYNFFYLNFALVDATKLNQVIPDFLSIGVIAALFFFIFHLFLQNAVLKTDDMNSALKKLELQVNYNFPKSVISSRLPAVCTDSLGLNNSKKSISHFIDTFFVVIILRSEWDFIIY